MPGWDQKGGGKKPHPSRKEEGGSGAIRLTSSKRAYHRRGKKKKETLFSPKKKKWLRKRFFADFTGMASSTKRTKGHTLLSGGGSNHLVNQTRDMLTPEERNSRPAGGDPYIILEPENLCSRGGIRKKLSSLNLMPPGRRRIKKKAGSLCRPHDAERRCSTLLGRECCAQRAKGLTIPLKGSSRSSSSQEKGTSSQARAGREGVVVGCHPDRKPRHRAEVGVDCTESRRRLQRETPSARPRREKKKKPGSSGSGAEHRPESSTIVPKKQSPLHPPFVFVGENRAPAKEKKERRSNAFQIRTQGEEKWARELVPRFQRRWFQWTTTKGGNAMRENTFAGASDAYSRGGAAPGSAKEGVSLGHR